MSKSFHSLKVVEKIEETADSCSFLFEIPEELLEQYKYRPGQYLTLKLDVAGKEQRRAYSIFTAVDDSRFGCTVKRVKGGTVSNHLIDNIKVGDQIEVMTPDGKFVVDPGQQNQKDHYFFAGGSGITPVMSMIATLLEAEPLSTCYLLYANRNEDSIIFKKQMDDMILRYENQFVVSHILSQPHQAKAGGLKGLFGKKSPPNWRGLRGRISNEILTRYMEDYPSKTNKDAYYLCGPAGLIEIIEQFLKGRGIEDVQIKKEYFTAADSTAPASAGAAIGGSCVAEVKLNGETFTINIPAGKSVLDTLVDEGKDPPYSCTSGACSTCVAKVLEGKVDMEACFALDPEEIEDGYVLTCQAKCTTPTLKLDYES